MHSTQLPLNNDYTHAVEDAIDAHEKSEPGNGSANPVISHQALAHGRINTFSRNSEEVEPTLLFQEVRIHPNLIPNASVFP